MSAVGQHGDLSWSPQLPRSTEGSMSHHKSSHPEPVGKISERQVTNCLVSYEGREAGRHIERELEERGHSSLCYLGKILYSSNHWNGYYSAQFHSDILQSKKNLFISYLWTPGQSGQKVCGNCTHFIWMVQTSFSSIHQLIKVIIFANVHLQAESISQIANKNWNSFLKHIHFTNLC